MKIHTLFHTRSGLDVIAWYSPSTRCWWAALRDARGNQIADALDAYTREGVTTAAQEAWGICKACGEPFHDRRCQCDIAHDENITES